jgi:hypothetical protein
VGRRGGKGNKKRRGEGPGEGEEGSSEQGEAREKGEAEGGMLLPISRGVVTLPPNVVTRAAGHPAPPLMKSYLCLCSCLPAPLIPSVSTFNGGQGVQII